MSVEQLQTVVAVAEEGSLVRAARRLHLTQPPVSRRLMALEDELGVSLFHRRARGVEPTEAGERFLPHARAILAALEQASRAARGLRSDPQATDGTGHT